MININNRLKKLERNSVNFEYWDIYELIKAGKFYDELTEEQKERYCRYRYGVSKSTHERLTILFSFPNAPEDFIHTPEDIRDSGIFHKRIEYRPKYPTKEEHARNVKEIQEYFENCDISEEERKQNRAENELLRRINEKRKIAMETGGDLNKYPAPWQKKKEGN